MTENLSSRVTSRRLIPLAIIAAFAMLILPTAPGCVAYQIYSGIKTAEKVKDFTEDHILKSDDDDDKDKNKNSGSSKNH